MAAAAARIILFMRYPLRKRPVARINSRRDRFAPGSAFGISFVYRAVGLGGEIAGLRSSSPPAWRDLDQARPALPGWAPSKKTKCLPISDMGVIVYRYSVFGGFYVSILFRRFA